jgi:hypothetical protein
MNPFAPRFEGELELPQVPDDFVARIRRRVKEGLLASGSRHRANYRVEHADLNEIAFTAGDFWTAANVGLSHVTIRRLDSTRLAYEVTFRRWAAYAIGLGAAILLSIVGLMLVFEAANSRQTPPTSPSVSWIGILLGGASLGFWCLAWPWILTALHKRSAARCLERILREELTDRPPTAQRTGRRYRSRVTVFGLPLVHVAMGAGEGKPRGHAKGIIAVGDIATGVVAVGGVARGVIAVGGVALGFIAVGGLAIGMAAVLGGLAIGALAVGGGAIGVVAQGGAAVGVVADGGSGGVACGYFARGFSLQGRHTVSGPDSSPPADEFLERWGWLIGSDAGSLQLLVWVTLVAGATLVLSGTIVLFGYIVGWRRLDMQSTPLR